MLFSFINDPMGTLISVLYMLPGLIIGFVLHEWGHAFAADKMGDNGPRNAGRLSLSPMAHIDWIGLSCFVLVGFGWAIPVKTNPYMYKNRKWGRIFVALAGVTMNLFLCIFFGFLYMLSLKTGVTALIMICFYGISVNATLFALNLLPIPPLDGSKVLMAFFPSRLDVWMKFERYGIIILLALSFLNILSVYISFVNGFLLSATLSLWRFLM